jgi:hypothetical protein
MTSSLQTDMRVIHALKLLREVDLSTVDQHCKVIHLQAHPRSTLNSSMRPVYLVLRAMALDMPVLNASPLSFLGKEFHSLFLLKTSKTLFFLSVLISCLSAASFASAMLADELGYGFLANMWTLWVCPIFYCILKNFEAGKTLLRLQEFVTCFFIVILIVLDSVSLAKITQNYRYCYGDLQDLCQEDDGLMCRKEYESSDDDLDEISCLSEGKAICMMLSIIFNYAGGLLLIPLLVVALVHRHYIEDFEAWRYERFAPEDLVLMDSVCILRVGQAEGELHGNWVVSEVYKARGEMEAEELGLMTS